ncbi:hypothetical protein [Plantibacter sp. RU18]|uniref:hypothetical protein n=1 Tax=Plantibacter sp. RU18 TaxID=3158143 RepID=UPI003D36CC89
MLLCDALVDASGRCVDAGSAALPVGLASVAPSCSTLVVSRGSVLRFGPGKVGRHEDVVHPLAIVRARVLDHVAAVGVAELWLKLRRPLTSPDQLGDRLRLTGRVDPATAQPLIEIRTHSRDLRIMLTPGRGRLVGGTDLLR